MDALVVVIVLFFLNPSGLVFVSYCIEEAHTLHFLLVMFSLCIFNIFSLKMYPLLFCSVHLFFDSI